MRGVNTMSVLKRGLGVLAILGAALTAHAQINYSNIVATITFEDASTSNLSVIQGTNSLDFFAGTAPLAIGAGTGHTSAVIEISYDASSASSLNQMDLLFTSFTQGSGSVDYSEEIFDGTGLNLLTSTSGSISNAGSWLQHDTLQFSSTDAIHVEKTFTLSLGFTVNGAPINDSVSLVGVIEQNAVPEPASMAALAIGGMGLLVRRRRKK
jgi:hypothetical protein